ncbi:MAG: uroporphyrinogen decarboxylase family protein [Candidatus Hodarchaeota archaeon]
MDDGIRSFEERQKATFEHKSVERIVWQPRFSDWYGKNCIHQLRPSMSPEELAKFNLKCPDLPKAIFGMDHVEVYDYLNASPRYPGECWPGMGFFYSKPNPDAEITRKTVIDDKGNSHTKITTPYGVVTEGRRRGSSYPDTRILKKKEDFKAVRYIVENSCVEYGFNEVMYEVYKEENQGRCVSVGGPWRSPYNKCIVELAGTMNTMLLMKRYPEEFDELCAAMERITFDIIMPVLMKSPVEYISCGDNVDSMNNPPPVYEKYILPYFQKVQKECEKAGKFTFGHYDGHLRDLLPYLSNDQFPLDGIEAPTILPQGDVSLEELRKALGDEKIVLDGIPSTIFLPHFSEEQFVKLVEDVLKAFSPNIILGVSDEYSPNGLFRRMEMVADIVANFEV